MLHTIRPSVLALAALCVGLGLSAAPANAQNAPDTLHACYVKGSGSVYRTGTAGTPVSCTKPTHVPFSWVSAPSGTGGGEGGSWSGVTVVVSAPNDFGLNPSSSLTFIGPVVTVTVNGRQAVSVSSQKSLGSNAVTGGQNLLLDMCYRPVGGTLQQYGMGHSGLQVPNGTRTVITLDAAFVLAAGTYEVGMCGFSTSPISWSNNGRGRTTAIILPVA